MRSAVPWLPASLSLLLLLAACGGGGGSPVGGAAAPALLSGGVTAVDGSTSDVSGVALRLRETGEQVVSSADGSFVFRAGAAGDVTVELDDGSEVPGPTDDASGDDADDSVEGEARCVRIRDVRDGERIDVRIRIRDDRIERVDIARRDANGTDGERELEIDMRRGPGADDRDMEGEVELEIDPRGESFEVEVEYATPGRVLRAVVIDLSGAEDDLGTRTVDVLGEAEWERETRDGQRLPFGVPSVVDLLGYEVQVRDADTGAVLLQITLPSMPDFPADDDRPDESDDDDADDDDADDDDADDDDADDAEDDSDGSDDDA
mgnify:CR=1 FL=1